MPDVRTARLVEVGLRFTDGRRPIAVRAIMVEDAHAFGAREARTEVGVARGARAVRGRQPART